MALFEWIDAHSAQLVLRLGAGVHEGLCDDVQRSVHHLRHVDVKDEVRVPQDVHPEPHRQAEDTQRHLLLKVTTLEYFFYLVLICSWQSCFISVVLDVSTIILFVFSFGCLLQFCVSF